MFDGVFVMFAGRLLRHLGARAKLFTVLPNALNSEYQNRQVVRFVAGGVQTLEMFGVPRKDPTNSVFGCW